MKGNLCERRSVEELITLYTLENDLLDIYVEGRLDYQIIKWFLEHEANHYVNVIEISNIEINAHDLLVKNYEDNNRDRIIRLIELLNENECTNAFIGIIDKDVLPFTREIPNIKNLLLTDYSCMEMYLNNKKNLKKIISLAFKNDFEIFEKKISHMNIMLKEIFAMRIYEKRSNVPLKKIDYNKFFEIKHGEIVFKFDEYLNGILLKNGLIKSIEEYKKEINTILLEIEVEDYRNTIQGHDFMSFMKMFFTEEKFISRQTPIENVESIFYGTLEYLDLSDYQLFQEITAKMGD